MVVTLSKKQIAGIVGFAAAILPKKTRIPALGCARFDADGKGNVLVALTDLEQSLVLTLAPERLAGEPERFLFPVAELKKLKSDAVTLQPAGEDAVICTALAGQRSFSRTIPVPPASEFPDLPGLPDEMTPCDVGAFLRAYRGAAFAASDEASRLTLNGVFAHAEESALVATDGRRLTRRALANFPFPGDAILPHNRMLLRQLPETDAGRIGLVEREDDCLSLALATEDLSYVCRCIDGTYPNYRSVIPDAMRDAAELVFGAGDLETVESVVPFLDKADKHAIFLFGKEDGSVLLGMEGKDGGDPAVLPLSGCRCRGIANLALALDGMQLVEAMKHGFLELRTDLLGGPVVFRDGDSGLHLLMPLRGEASNALFDAAGVERPEEASAPSGEEDSAEPAPPESAVPAPEPIPEEQPKEKPAMSAPIAVDPKPRTIETPDTPEDPIARLEELADECLVVVQQALATVRELKRQVRAAKTHFRTREKEIEAREREMEKSRGLIQRLQEAIAA